MFAILVFLGISYGLSISLGLVVGLSGGNDGALAGLRFAAMFIPAISVLVLTVSTGERVRVDWSRFPVRYLPLALLLMPFVLHAVMLPLMAASEAGLPWFGWLTPAPDGLYHTPADLGWGTLTGYGLAGRIAVNAVVGLMVVSFLAFFEEIGWRGWLQPRLASRMGARKAVIVTAVVWALWHVPFDLSGVQHIDGVSPMDLALGVPLGVAATGLILGWLWMRTESIWLVSIAHGALNNWGQYAFKYMEDSVGPEQVARDLQILGTGFGGLLIVGLLLLVLANGSRGRAERGGPIAGRWVENR